MNNYQYYPSYYGYQPQQTYMQPQYVPQQLNCKIVDSEEIAKIQEVQIGSYGIFPKGDMSTIYVKSWMPDGTTKLVSFIPQVEEIKEETTNDNYADYFDSIQKSISEINKKIDGLKQPSSSIPMTKSRKGGE